MIIYFSGNGNTRHCVLTLATILGESVHELSPDELRHPDNATFEAEGERVVWAFPTYSWGIPPVVVKVIAKAQFGENITKAKHFMLTTCGDDMGYTDRQWRKLIEKRGLKAAGAFAVIMPNTYTLMKGFDIDSNDVADRKIAQSADRIELIAKAIIGGGDDMLIPGSFPWIKSMIVYPWFCRFAMSPKPFHATGGCTSCGHCSGICPMANISMAEDGTPRFGKNCALCLRCYHSCPRHAIAYGKATDGKGTYQFKKKR